MNTLQSRALKNIIAYYVGATFLACSEEEQNVRLAHCANLHVAPRSPLLVHQLPGLMEVRHLADQIAELATVSADELEEIRDTASWLFVRDALYWAVETIRMRLWRHDSQAADGKQLYQDWGLLLVGMNMLMSHRVGSGIPFLNDGRVPNMPDARSLNLFTQIANKEGIVWEQSKPLSLAAAWGDRRIHIQRSKAFSAFYQAEDVRGPYLAALRAKASRADRCQHPAAVELVLA